MLRDAGLSARYFGKYFDFFPRFTAIFSIRIDATNTAAL